MPDLSFHDGSEMPPAPQRNGRSVSDTEASPTPSERQVEAQRTLLSLTPMELRHFVEEAVPNNPQAIDTLLRILTRERAAHSNKMAFWIAGGILLSLGAVIATLMTLPFPIIPAGYILVALVLARGCFYPRSPLERAALDYLLSIVAPRHIPLLLEQRPLVTSAGCARIDALLLQLIPRTTAADWIQMTSRQQDEMTQLLSPTFCFRNRALSVAIIELLGRFGDQRALVPLYHLAAVQTSTSPEPALRTAAQAALHTLEARLDFGQPHSVPAYLNTVFSAGNTHSSASNVPIVTLYALLALLPKLTPENYFQILSLRDRGWLYALFAPATTGNYAYGKLRLYREIVHTLERVGDTDALYALNTLATMRTPFEGARHLRNTAETALNTLQAQAEKANAGRTLLRASAAPDVSPHELLRSVAPAPSTTHPNELLRVSAPPDENTSPLE